MPRVILVVHAASDENGLTQTGKAHAELTAIALNKIIVDAKKVSVWTTNYLPNQETYFEFQNSFDNEEFELTFELKEFVDNDSQRLYENIMGHSLNMAQNDYLLIFGQQIIARTLQIMGELEHPPFLGAASISILLYGHDRKFLQEKIGDMSHIV